MPEIVARWQSWDGEGLEHLVLTAYPDAIFAEAVVVGGEGEERFAIYYRIQCDGAWRTKTVEMGITGQLDRRSLYNDGAGTWESRDAGRLTSLNGAIDVDITATPFTNTLPIRRLGLEAGQSADITVAYIDVPSLTLSTDRQRYTCLEPMRRYRFESLDGDFLREIEVDEHGLVVLYPGLFRRIL